MGKRPGVELSLPGGLGSTQSKSNDLCLKPLGPTVMKRHPSLEEYLHHLIILKQEIKGK